MTSEDTNPMKRVGITICNYNKKEMVCDCIRSVLEQNYRDFDLYVVDNASTDGSAREIRKRFPEGLTLLCNYENLGGSGGFNTGLRKMCEQDYEYLMCVDNDALLDEDAVGELVAFLDAHPECGMAGSKIYHLERPEIVQNFGQAVDFDYFCTEAYYLGRVEDGSMPEFVYADAVPACSLMVRRSVVNEIGLLPEENFLYWDDTEWGYLCNLAGHKVASVGASKACHAMGAKKEDVNTFPTYYACNWIRFFMKFTPREKWVDMAGYFLSSIYEVEFWGNYNEVYSKANTVMAAYDDAIHGVTGKAGPDRIFEMDQDENFSEPYEKVKEEFDRGKELFVYSQLPLFIRQIQKFREGGQRDPANYF